MKVTSKPLHSNSVEPQTLYAFNLSFVTHRIKVFLPCLKIVLVLFPLYPICTKCPWKTLLMHPEFKFHFWSHISSQITQHFFQEMKLLVFTTFLYYLGYIWKQADRSEISHYSSVLSFLLAIGLLILVWNLLKTFPK